MPERSPLPPGPGHVASRSVDFGYEPGASVLEDIDLEIPAGRTLALIGRTGSGKTTLAALVPRFYDATAGRVLVDGVDVSDLQRRSLRREIGVISQDPFLFSASVRDNIAFGMPDAPHEAVEAAARAAQAHDFIVELPHGYETVIGERGITLSGGQRQRIAIARALLIDPRILVLDDATASVDATTEARIRAGLREVMRGRTTIIIAHRLSTIALADEIVVLDHGPDRSRAGRRRSSSRRARSSGRSTSTGSCSRWSPDERSLRRSAPLGCRTPAALRHTLGTKTFPIRTHFRVTLAVGGGPGCPVRRPRN